MANVLLDFEELPHCGNSLSVLRCITPCLDCVHPKRMPLRKGLEGVVNPQSGFTSGVCYANSTLGYTEPPESPVFCGAKNAPK
jgi:hypothetical protein